MGDLKNIAPNSILCGWLNVSVFRFLILLIACVIFPNTASSKDDLLVAGWIEQAILFPDVLKVHAKLDTGAKTSSINAVDPFFFTKNGDSWVRFSLTNRDESTIILERPVIRTTTIKRHFGDSQKRPVITLDICVGEVRKKVDVNLVDRSGLNYQLLIGRNFLRGSLLIDSGQTYLTSPDCSGS